MRAQVTERKRSARSITILITVVGLSSTVLSASAASVGGIDGGALYAMSGFDSVPLPLAFDEFDGCSGNLNGDQDALGNPWSASNNDWRCNARYFFARNRENVHVADSVTLDVGQSDHLTVSSQLIRTSRLAAGAGSGLSILHDGGGYHFYLVYQRGQDQVTLGKVDGSGDTEIVSFPWLPRTGTDLLLEVAIAQPTLTLYANGVLLGTHTMTAAEVATFGSSTRFGLESDLDRRSRWEWFQVEDDS